MTRFIRWARATGLALLLVPLTVAAAAQPAGAGQDPDSSGHVYVPVNAGSDDVSLLEIDDDGLELADVQPVGDRP